MGFLFFFDADRLTPIKEKRAKSAEICRFAASSDCSCHLTLKNDGTFTYYEGALSSYIGGGTWTAEKEGVVLKDGERTFCFAIERDALVFVADRSDAFLYVDVQDGERFVKP